MTVAYVRNADSSGGLVGNWFIDSAGVPHTVSDFYTDDAGVPHQVFFTYLPTSTTQNRGRVFRAIDSRIFIATDKRTFTV